MAAVRLKSPPMWSGSPYLASKIAFKEVSSVTILTSGQIKVGDGDRPQDRGFILQHSTHGMHYRDPDADHYERHYRSRVLGNLQRRAKSLGFVLQAVPGDDPAVS
jgi:hypothetical protein